LKRDEKTNNSLLRDRLSALIPEARKTTTLEDLDAMQAEVDEIVNDTLNCYDDGAIDHGDLSAFNLLLDQFHHAVADREVSLNNPAAELARSRHSNVSFRSSAGNRFRLSRFSTSPTCHDRCFADGGEVFGAISWPR
jgi:hypothetical protein